MIEQNEKAKLLEERTIIFSVNVIKTLSPYGKVPSYSPLVNQLIKSATSIGANYHEANNASSPADFKSKIYISKKEAAETEYWLEVLGRLMPEEDFSSLKEEARHFLMIFQKIISTMKARNEKSEK